MNKLLTKIVKSQDILYQLSLSFINSLFSVICAMITQDLAITILYIIAIGIINMCAIICDFPEFDNLFVKFLNAKKSVTYIIFVVVAVLPTALGLLGGKLDFSRPEYYLDNLLPNLFGALIVCSLMQYVSNLKMEPVVAAFIHEKGHLFSCFLPLSFNLGFLNSINYTLQNGVKILNLFDCIYLFNFLHLFLAVFFGCVSLIIIVCRIIDRTPLECAANQLYPQNSLIFGAAFLVSYGVPSIFWENAKHEYILLIFDTLGAIIIAWAVFGFIFHRTSKFIDEYPFKPLIIFSGVISLNALFCTVYRKGDSEAHTQFTSGIIVISVCILIILFLLCAMIKTDTKSN